MSTFSVLCTGQKKGTSKKREREGTGQGESNVKDDVKKASLTTSKRGARTGDSLWVARAFKLQKKEGKARDNDPKIGRKEKRLWKRGSGQNTSQGTSSTRANQVWWKKKVRDEGEGGRAYHSSKEDGCRMSSEGLRRGGGPLINSRKSVHFRGNGEEVLSRGGGGGGKGKKKQNKLRSMDWLKSR